MPSPLRLRAFKNSRPNVFFTLHKFLYTCSPYHSLPIARFIFLSCPSSNGIRRLSVDVAVSKKIEVCRNPIFSNFWVSVSRSIQKTTPTTSARRRPWSGRWLIHNEVVTDVVGFCSKDVRLPIQMQRAMAAEAESAREAKAKVCPRLSLLS